MRSTSAPWATPSISRLINSEKDKKTLCPTFLHCPTVWSTDHTVGKAPKLRTGTSGFCLGSASDSPELDSAGDGTNLRFVLHDSLDAAGIDTKHARAGREGFCQQVGRFTGIRAETSIAISGGADLARTALNIAAEDDSLVSHSSVPLPDEAFLERLDDLSMGFCSLHLPPLHSPPDAFLRNLERYFYVHKGFRRTDMISDARSLYLHSVLTCRSGTAIMLSLIYSEMLKTLRICGFLDFDVEIYYPCDNLCLPSGYQKQKSKFSDQTHILTSKSLVVEILRKLKDAFWPFQHDHLSSLFLRAAHAANHALGPIASGENHSKSYNMLEIASTKAAHHRLGRGVWTNARFGDMRRALAACERLIILGTGLEELRDYAALLYHCGRYEDCFEYLNLYQSSRVTVHRHEVISTRILMNYGELPNMFAKLQVAPPLSFEITNSLMPEPDGRDQYEEDAVKQLSARVNLILSERGWSKGAVHGSYWGNSIEPW